jgi:hypothetical protein
MQALYARHLKKISVMLSGQNSQLLARGSGLMIQKMGRGANKWDMLRLLMAQVI